LYRFAFLSLAAELLHDCRAVIIGRAQTAQEAIAAASSLERSAVLLDVDLPDGDGVEVPEAMSSWACCPRTEVVRIVGYSIDSRLKATLAVAALRNAIARRAAAGTIVHPDRTANSGRTPSSGR
jgi:CheY-like chemotaxis protein